MDRVIGGVFGLAAFVSVVALSISKGVPFETCVGRSVVAMILGYWVGRWVFGVPGLTIVKEAAGPIPPQAEVPVETKPSGSGPGQGPSSKASS